MFELNKRLINFFNKFLPVHFNSTSEYINFASQQADLFIVQPVENKN